MQVYKGMDIGTAKPTAAQRARVPHHLIDVAALEHDFTAAEYQRQAREAIDEISGRFKLPLLVGGSGLYVRAAVDDLEFPPQAAEAAAVRRELTELADRGGADAMHAMLMDVDPESAAAIHPNDVRRVIRALEVYLASGRPFSSFPKAWRTYTSVYDLMMIGLKAERPHLNRLIDKRVDRMIAEGLVDEVRRLRKAGHGDALASKRALGYTEVMAHLAGEMPLETAVARIKSNTRRFAKRQMTWFTADPRVIWFVRTEEDTPHTLALSLESAIIKRL